MNKWNLKLNNTVFDSNIAGEKGGAIFYDFARPSFGDNITYTNNSAQYGPDIASYAVKITLYDNPSSSIKITNLGSGITYEEVLKLAVRDYDNQIMILNNENQIIITSPNASESQVGGFNSASLRSGVADFDNFVVSAEPGVSGIFVNSASKAIDSSKITNVFGNLISNNSIELDFRF